MLLGVLWISSGGRMLHRRSSTSFTLSPTYHGSLWNLELNHSLRKCLHTPNSTQCMYSKGIPLIRSNPGAKDSQVGPFTPWIYKSKVDCSKLNKLVTVQCNVCVTITTHIRPNDGNKMSEFTRNWMYLHTVLSSATACCANCRVCLSVLGGPVGLSVSYGNMCTLPFPLSPTLALLPAWTQVYTTVCVFQYISAYICLTFLETEWTPIESIILNGIHNHSPCWQVTRGANQHGVKDECTTIRGSYWNTCKINDDLQYMHTTRVLPQ